MEYLFSKLDGFAVIENQIEQAKRKAQSITEARLKATDDGSLVEELVTQYGVTVPEVKWEAATVTRSETQVDLMYQPGTMASYERRSVMTSGEKFAISVPYVGESDVFRIRPSSFNLNPPRATVSRTNLLFEYEAVQVDTEQAKGQYERAKAEISQNLARIQADFGNLAERVAGAVRPIIAERRRRMTEGEARLSAFGLPVK